MVYGDQVPAFMMDMLTGPHSYIPGETFIDVNGNSTYENGIDTPLDTAVNYLGPIGIRVYPGAKNMELTSMICYFSGAAGYSEPNNINQVRNYMMGLSPAGSIIDPCIWLYGEVRGGVQCNEADPHFWLSGDPVSNVGWICNQNNDVRGLGSTGPFNSLS